jgi:arylsulfatase A-like enzyme
MKMHNTGPMKSKNRFLLFIAATLCCAQAFSADSKPNILLLVAEDMSARVGAFGDATAVTPNLDSLAAEGLRLPNAFTTAGVCAPSRAALITGMHQISIGAQHMRTSTHPAGSYKSVPPPHIKAFPELLRAAGYYTFTDSKLDYQFSGTTAGSGPFTLWDAEGRNTGWEDREPDQPFFGMINFMATHESGTFDPLGYWPDSLLHLGMQIYRAMMFGIVSDSNPVSAAEVTLPPYYPDIPSVRREMARHYNNIHSMDRQVGELLTQLERDGLTDNTIVIWTTDHGDGLPRAKRELYDSGIKVPMIIRWPQQWRPAGIKPGTQDRRLISFVDLAPTILAMAGVPAPDYLQGSNFLSPEIAPRNYIFASRDRIDEIEDRQRAARDKRFKYIRSWHPGLAGGHPLAFRDLQQMTRDMRSLWKAGKLNEAQAKWFQSAGEEQLYDLHDDPHELRNLASNPDYQQTLSRMRSALQDWLKTVEDMGETPEQQMISDFLCGDRQCVTPPPKLTIEHGRLNLSSDIPGASIGFRLDNGDWRPYQRPVPVAGLRSVEAKAVRYGWEESTVTSRKF